MTEKINPVCGECNIGPGDPVCSEACFPGYEVYEAAHSEGLSYGIAVGRRQAFNDLARSDIAAFEELANAVRGRAIANVLKAQNN